MIKKFGELVFIEIAKKEKKFLFILLIVSFIIRALVFNFYLNRNKNYWQVDSNAYHKIAINIAQNKGYVTNGQYNFYRVPGYPLFLSLFYKIFDMAINKALWFQLILASLIPILIFLLSLVLFPKLLLLAKIASIYSAFHLGLILYSGFFMTESLFIFLFLIFSILYFSSFHLFFCRRHYFSYQDLEKMNPFLYCSSEICTGPSFIALEKEQEVKYEKKIKYNECKKIFLAGIFLGMTSLVRPVGHYMIILPIILLFFSSDILKIKIKKIVFLFSGWLFIVFWWLLRNWMLTGYIFFHTLPGGHFLYFSAARIVTHTQNLSYEDSKKYLQNQLDQIVQNQEQKLNRKLNEIELCNIRQDLAIKYFKNYPILAIKNWITDILRTSLSLYSAEIVYLYNNRKEFDYFNKNRNLWSLFERYLLPKVDSVFLRLIIWVEILLFMFILVGFFGFIILAIFKRYYLCSFLKVIPFIWFFIFIGLSGGYSRMRLPIEPFLIIFSFSFWANLFKRFFGEFKV
ncbi:hypothetical protein GF322_01835 [Candidatus Dependentiae bacterium]|nr:hypothetical protein [Candidatus Dependentiae bacterium]